MRRQIIVVLAVSGALAGIAGATQIASVTYALEPRAIEAGGLGFTGIVVAVARATGTTLSGLKTLVRNGDVLRGGVVGDRNSTVAFLSGTLFGLRSSGSIFAGISSSRFLIGFV